MSGAPASLPEPPYYAVIFTSRLAGSDPAGYAEAADRMLALARGQQGYLGFESARDPLTGQGVTVSYWTDLDAITRWRKHPDHAATRERGRAEWYSDYALQVARVERAYAWRRPSET